MNSYKIFQVIAELGISRSYLYKLIEQAQLILPKTTNGRFIWNRDTINQVKQILNHNSTSSCSEPHTKFLITDQNQSQNLTQNLTQDPHQNQNTNQNSSQTTTSELMDNLGLKQVFINNRRYLGNKFSLSDFILRTVNQHCSNVKTVADVFCGTGSVANIFKDKVLITNDLLYSNYLSNYAWFGTGEYDSEKIIRLVASYNQLQTSDNNYMRQNFADTFFSADDCSKIGYIRQDIEDKYQQKLLNFKEYAILITTLLYAMDKIANTVGHYDAYRKNVEFKRSLQLNVILPEPNLNSHNLCYNTDANQLITEISCDLLYLDPPYNSRQYCDAYHLLENVAKWQQPPVYGVARKMNRDGLKSDYCVSAATKSFADLIENAKAKYILLSYNNMHEKGNDRSNAKISDQDILQILRSKGKVVVFEEDYKSFSTGKSNIQDNKERLFLCEVGNFTNANKLPDIACPFNYTGGKFKLLKQLTPLFKSSPVFLDVFAGGGNVSINSSASKIILNDANSKIIDLIAHFKNTPTEELLASIDAIIEQYQLSNTALYGYDYYGCNSASGLANYNREPFRKLREDYNQALHSSQLVNLNLLYVLMIFAFNNQMRFNGKGEFNSPVGKRDFNAKMRSKLILFSQALKQKDITFLRQDFRTLDLDSLDPQTFIYCDPPYLITQATYNENGQWTEQDEQDLLAFLDQAHAKGFSFALSNVLESKEQQNHLLIKWLENRDYTCHFIDKTYAHSNYQRKHKISKSTEVLITNYTN